MTTFKTARTLFLISAAAGALAACGADDVASPGEGVLVVPPPGGGGGSGGGSGGGGGSTGGPADSCPNGTANVGTIEVGGSGSGDERRVCQVSGTITGNLVLPNNAGTIYSLSGKVQVGQDAGPDVNNPTTSNSGILTIEAGVTLFGASGADFLLVNRGSQLIVDGEADSPVVMTSRNNVVGTATDDSIGQWGGLVILGRAPIGDCADAGATGGTLQCQAPVEGTSGSVYGGANASDSSGRIEYLQVRYPGFKVDTNNELNGITLAGVGSGTIFNHVQVHNSSDDGIEWFGGRVNQSHLVLTGNDDDSIDADSGFKGAIQFAIVVQRATGGDRFIELDSDDKPVDATPRTDLRLSNFTFVSPNAKAVTLRGGADARLLNGVIFSAGSCLDIDQDATIQTSGPDENGAPSFISMFLACGANPFVDDSNVTAAQVAAIFNAEATNEDMGTSSLFDVFVNGANENARTATNPTGASSFFQNVTYIGAVRDANDNWWKGWTCGTPGQASCLSIPAAG
ncbi:hypothetical protein [Sphingomicrobium flavum]|uniref:hypothetical protein n=1 Tax=Sphingomicrobium flavum TaxID=1229164 RepID=UPI0021ADFB80|nr:hypothetical protein [Sphingomicrobium flavum]